MAMRPPGSSGERSSTYSLIRSDDLITCSPFSRQTKDQEPVGERRSSRVRRSAALVARRSERQGGARDRSGPGVRVCLCPAPGGGGGGGCSRRRERRPAGTGGRTNRRRGALRRDRARRCLRRRRREGVGGDGGRALRTARRVGQQRR